MTVERIVLLAVAVMSAFTFLVFAWDKRAARRKGRRVPERTLLLLAAALGSPGAFLAQDLLRHKTRKEPFRTRFWLIAGVQILMLLAWGLWGRRGSGL
ncbi:MAG: DUF1294 domain-containing protein [Myxococcales bacterium]|nr:DUF1294 domain-containing protein [Myxococcales bacterium]